ncbi:hypothetical protein MBLNU459_g8003t1 [Dothideomycetes sp. NU459]
MEEEKRIEEARAWSANGGALNGAIAGVIDDGANSTNSANTQSHASAGQASFATIRQFVDQSGALESTTSASAVYSTLLLRPMRTHVWRKSLIRLSRRPAPAPALLHRRRFHQTPSALSTPAPPPPSDPARPGNRDDVESARKAAEDAAVSHPAAAADGEHVPDRSTRQPFGGRRSLRRSTRPKEVAPFTVPDWFLRYNVTLHETKTPDKHAKTKTQLFTLVDSTTGHTVLTLPYHSVEAVDNPYLGHFFSARDVDVGIQLDQLASSTELSRDLERLGQHDENLTADAKRAADQLSSPKRPSSSPLDPKLLLYLQLQLALHAAFSVNGTQASKFTRSNVDIQASDPYAHDELDAFVQDVADLVEADVIRLDANDLAELAGDYVESGDHGPGSISSLAYDVYKNHGATGQEHVVDIEMPDESAPDDAQEPSDIDRDSFEGSFSAPPFGGIDIQSLSNFLKQNAGSLSKALEGRGVVGVSLGSLGNLTSSPRGNPASSSEIVSRNTTTATVGSWDEYKLQTLLDTLIDSTATKKATLSGDAADTFLRTESKPSNSEEDRRRKPSKDGFARFLKDYLVRRVDSSSAKNESGLSGADKVRVPQATSHDENAGQRTIVHIRDLEPLRETPQGEAIIHRLCRIVQRRRKDGEQIAIIGTSAGIDSKDTRNLEHDEDDEDPHFRLLHFPTTSSIHPVNARGLISTLSPLYKPDRTLSKPAYRRILEINLRNLQDAMRRLGLQMSNKLFHPSTRSHLNIPGTWRLGESVLTQDDIQQIALYSESLRSLYTEDGSIETFHVAFAAGLLQSIENTLAPLTGFHVEPVIPAARPRGSSKDGEQPKRGPKKLDMDQLKKNCSKHETKLLSGVVDPQNIKTTFNDVHAAKATIEALQTLTTLSLMRPEAFSYGVLANDRLPGLLLYGPPGTGKTLLAKAVAKESQATVLEVSGAQVYEKYVGEGEKMVKAVFSLAKKLSPCIVFIDEADALFGSRGGANNRTTHREIINQFLREWDGMDDHSVFMMVATNRPFDLDDAVLRRLPRRLLVDLPVAKDRESILGIHLKGETLDSTVSLTTLAEQTPLYSGSDLKNLSVAAALAAVREENALLSQNKENKEFKLPERRTLTSKHFDTAMAEISASINEDMSSLSAIRKFDEQYGDRRGRKKKSGYGFGATESEVDENAARVRQDDPRP